MNPGDLDWSSLTLLGEAHIYDATAPEALMERCRDAVAILTNKVAFGEAEMDALPSLRYIGVNATGVNVVDIDAAQNRGITVTNVPAYSSPSVAQHTFALLLHLTNHVASQDAAVRDGRWAAAKTFCLYTDPLHEIQGLTLGIVGLGAIGTKVAEIGRAFGMEVIALVRGDDSSGWVERVAFDELLARSDVLTLHAPLTPETRHIISESALAKMKSTSLLLNTSRGGLIDEAALARALEDERIAGAGLDVLSIEPPAGGSPLIGAKNCVITPHVAWATRESRSRLLDQIVDNLACWLENRPKNVVS